MATKLDAMKALSDATMRRITSSRKNWMDYLDATAWLYKYPFYDQLMIYAQRPDARAYPINQASLFIGSYFHE